LGIFGRIGVYGIVATVTVPILCGIVFPALGKRSAWAAASAGLCVRCTRSACGPRRAGWMCARCWGLWSIAAPYRAVSPTPPVTATYGTFARVLAALPGVVLVFVRCRRALPVHAIAET
jgi:hypothetical protein